MHLWFDSPASRWLDGLPLGNGRVGAMWFGDGQQATIALNDETFFSAAPEHRDLTGAGEALTEVRRLLRQGDPLGAQRSAGALLGSPAEMSAFQPLGQLLVRTGQHGERLGFRRSLDLSTGVAEMIDQRACGRLEQHLVAVRDPSVVLLRTIASAAPMEVRPGGTFVDRVEWLDSSTLVATGTWREITSNGRPVAAGSYRLRHASTGKHLRFAIALRVVSGTVAHEGAAAIIGEGLSMLAMTTATDLHGGDPWDQCRERLEAIADADQAFVRGASAHCELMSRAAVEIDAPLTQALEQLPTDRRMHALRAGGVDDGLLLTLADFGRYLLIASAVGGELPPNLQGIWNEDIEPAWSSRWTLNINLQMNLWAAGPWNLPEVSDQLAAFMTSLAVSGRITAREIYGAAGWVVHHNTDVWRATEPTTMTEVGLFPGATVWLCDQLWDLHRFESSDHLLDQLVPLLLGAMEFVKGWLVPDNVGRLVTSPSSTPENAYLMPGVARPSDIGADVDYARHAWLCESPTLDVWLVRALIDACVAVGEQRPDLTVDIGSLQDIKSRLRPIPIIDGTIPEWTTDERPREIGHRHLSPLYGVFPGTLDVESNPDIAAAAAATLIQRQAYQESSANGWGGWSRVWAGCLWARLGDGERAYDSVLHWVRTTVSPSSLLCTFPEFDGQPPADAVFQVDANLGFPAVIAEMLLQSHADEVVLLPALPARWASGRFRGLRARGGHLIDAHWRDRRLTEVTIRPAADVHMTLSFGTPRVLVRTLTLQSGVPLTIDLTPQGS